jgi:hypothetical protein
MIRRFDAAAGNLLGFLRTLAILATATTVLMFWVGGAAVALPAAKAAALCWLPVVAPPFFSWLFGARTGLAQLRAFRQRSDD